MRKKISVKMNYIYNLFYQVLAVAIPLVTTPYVSRILGADGIGAYSYTLSIATYFGIFGSLGVDLYGQLQIAKNRDNTEKISQLFFEIFFARMATMGVSMFIYFVICLSSRTHSGMFGVLYIYLFAQMFDIAWFYNGLEMFKLTVTRNSLIKLICLILIFVAVKNKSDIYVYIVILQGSSLLGNVSLFLYLKKHIDFKAIKTIKLSHFREHWINSVVYFLPSLASTVFATIDKSMINWILRSDYENGYYEQASKIYHIAAGIVNSMSVVMLPRMTYLWRDEENNLNQIKSLILKTLRSASLLAVPIGFGLFAISELFVPVFYGAGYEKCIQLIRIFSPMVLFSGFRNIVGHQCLMARGKQKEYNIVTCFGAILNVILNYLMISFFGVEGAAIATLITEIFIVVMFMWYGRSVLSVMGVFKALIPYVMYGGCMGAAVWMYSQTASGIIGIGCSVILGIIVYVILLTAFRDQLWFSLASSIIMKIKGMVKRESK